MYATDRQEVRVGGGPAARAVPRLPPVWPTGSGRGRAPAVRLAEAGPAEATGRTPASARTGRDVAAAIAMAAAARARRGARRTADDRTRRPNSRRPVRRIGSSTNRHDRPATTKVAV